MYADGQNQSSIIECVRARVCVFFYVVTDDAENAMEIVASSRVNDTACDHRVTVTKGHHFPQVTINLSKTSHFISMSRHSKNKRFVTSKKWYFRNHALAHPETKFTN